MTEDALILLILYDAYGANNAYDIYDAYDTYMMMSCGPSPDIALS